jgi:hypothetical protein
MRRARRGDWRDAFRRRLATYDARMLGDSGELVDACGRWELVDVERGACVRRARVVSSSFTVTDVLATRVYFSTNILAAGRAPIAHLERDEWFPWVVERTFPPRRRVGPRVFDVGRLRSPEFSAFLRE